MSKIPPPRACSKCKIVKPSTEFHKGARKDGLNSQCKGCVKDYMMSGSCYDCGKQIARTSTRCDKCRGLATRGEASPYWKGGYTREDGYRMVVAHGHPNAYPDGSIREHTLVMANHLGRGLFVHENVHHKNGVRDDNRIENLELWSTSQPAGQRVEDKIEWAKTLLEEYGYLITKEEE